MPLPSVKKELFAARFEFRSFPVPLCQQCGKLSAFDCESHLVRAGEAIDRRPPHEITRMLPADLIDQHECRANGTICLSVGYDEADSRDRQPAVFCRGRFDRQRYRLELNSRKLAF